MRVFFGLFLFLSFAVAQSCSGSNCQSCTQQGSGSCEWCLSTSSCLSSSNSNCTSYIQNPSYCPPLQVRERTKRAACFSFFSSSSLTSDFSLQCSSFSDCISCSNSGCGWCLDTSACVNVPSPSCNDLISESQFCPSNSSSSSQPTTPPASGLLRNGSYTPSFNSVYCPQIISMMNASGVFVSYSGGCSGTNLFSCSGNTCTCSSSSCGGSQGFSVLIMNSTAYTFQGDSGPAIFTWQSNSMQQSPVKLTLLKKFHDGIISAGALRRP